jgi:hypothetical protein
MLLLFVVYAGLATPALSLSHTQRFSIFITRTLSPPPLPPQCILDIELSGGGVFSCLCQDDTTYVIVFGSLCSHCIDRVRV